MQRYTDLIRNRGSRTGRVLRHRAHPLDAYDEWMLDINWDEPGWWTSSLSLEMTSNRDMMEGIRILPLLLRLYCNYAFPLQRVPKTYLQICMAWVRRPPIQFIKLPGPYRWKGNYIFFPRRRNRARVKRDFFDIGHFPHVINPLIQTISGVPPPLPPQTYTWCIYIY